MTISKKNLVIGGVALGLVGLMCLTNTNTNNTKAEPITNYEEELTYLNNYVRLYRALDKMVSEDEDLKLLFHDLIRIEDNEWLWTYSVYDSYLDENVTVRMAFNNDITECVWVDAVEDDEYETFDPEEEVNLEELWSYME